MNCRVCVCVLSVDTFNRRHDNTMNRHMSLCMNTTSFGGDATAAAAAIAVDNMSPYSLVQFEKNNLITYVDRSLAISVFFLFVCFFAAPQNVYTH